MAVTPQFSVSTNCPPDGKLGIVKPDCSVASGTLGAPQLAPPLAVQTAGPVQERPGAGGSRNTEPLAFEGPALLTVMV